MVKEKWEHYCGGERGGWRPGLTKDCPQVHHVHLQAPTDRHKLDAHWKVK